MGEAVKQKDARRERPNWGLALLMRPAKAAPGVPFVNSPLCQRPNVCVTNCRGLSDPVVPYEPPCLLTVYIFRCAGAPVKSREASNLLAAVCGRFTEVFETLGPKEAKAPLEELAS